ncbi:MAG TPA: hypothetical protein VMW07_01990 [Gallionella sp.]|nr:hypothetical protein [Gallionella sp.]
MEPNSPNDPNVLTEIITSLNKLSKEDQKRTLQAVATFLNLPLQESHGTHVAPTHSSAAVSHSTNRTTFSEDRTISPKDFMREKAPLTDVERATCLAYYLTHYRDTPHFKTLDISTLNTEAAQPKFSNASIAVDNASKAGLLVQAVKGSKQISSAGELYVQHLPDREAAKSGIQGIRPKRKPRKTASKNLKNTKKE